MTDLNHAFSKLLNRQLTDTEIQELYRVRDALGIENNDALWLLFGGLHEFKSNLVKRVEKVFEECRSTAEAVSAAESKKIETNSAQTQAKLADAVASAANKVAHFTAQKERDSQRVILISWLAAIFALFVASCWGSHFIGWDDGYANGHEAGYQLATTEKARESWANTPEGKLAYRFAETHQLQNFALCEGKTFDGKIWGIDKKQNACFTNGPSAWYLPK